KQRLDARELQRKVGRQHVFADVGSAHDVEVDIIGREDDGRDGRNFSRTQHSNVATAHHKAATPMGWLTSIDHTASARDHDSDSRVSSRRWANECCEPSRLPSLAHPPKLSCRNPSIENQVDYRNGVLECTPQLMVLRIIRVDHPFDLNTGRVELVFL